MKLEIGKYYKTRCGTKVGPIKYAEGPIAETYPYSSWMGTRYETWTENGKNFLHKESIHDLIEEWCDEPNLKTWQEMTPEEKGALLLAYHEGKTIQVSRQGLAWSVTQNPNWSNDQFYRVKEEPVEKTESHMFFHNNERYVLEFKTIGGKLDCSSPATFIKK